MLRQAAAITCLSYTAILGFPRYQCLQVSPQHPALFLVPQQPTCQVWSHAFQLVPTSGLITTFHGQQAHTDLLGCPFHRRPILAWIGSKGAFQLPAPGVATRAQLQACSFTMLRPIGNRPRGASAPRAHRGGWLPPRCMHEGVASPVDGLSMIGYFLISGILICPVSDLS